MNKETYIQQSFPGGLPYNDAAQLCLRLYCSVNNIPKHLHSQCSKDNLAEVFSRLASHGFITDVPLSAAIYGANFHSIQDKGHWIEVIASIFKKGNTVDMERGSYLVNQLIAKN